MSLDLAQINMRIALVTPHLRWENDCFMLPYPQHFAYKLMDELIGCGIFAEIMHPEGAPYFWRRFKLLP